VLASLRVAAAARLMALPQGTKKVGAKKLNSTFLEVRNDPGNTARPIKVAAVALANKIARMAWA
jgi:hypothetical protein